MAPQRGISIFGNPFRSRSEYLKIQLSFHLWSQTNEDPVFPHIHWKRLQIARTLQVLSPGNNIKTVAMPWTNDLPPVIEFSFAERFSVMRATVTHRQPSLRSAHQANSLTIDQRQLRLMKWKFGFSFCHGREQFYPNHTPISQTESDRWIRSEKWGSDVQA